jgi:hypothetical protein
MNRPTLIAMIAAAPLLSIGPLPASAAPSAAMKSCSEEWQRAKEADPVPAKQTWPRFWSQCSKDYAAAHGTKDEATTVTPEEPKTKTRTKKTKAIAVNEDEPSGSSAADKKACDDKWNKASSGKHGWKAYFTYIAKCMP